MNRIPTSNDSLIGFKNCANESFSETSFIKKLQKSFNPDSFTCQGCSCVGNCKKSSSYKRYFITPENYNSSNSDDQRINVDCIYCKTCNYHHANLYDMIIPYRSYSLSFIMQVLSDYAKHNCTIVELCDKWHIAISTLYNWRDTFRRHYQMWCHAMFLRDKLSDSINQVFNQPNIISDFFNTTSFSFLQPNNKTHSHLSVSVRRFMPS